MNKHILANYERAVHWRHHSATYCVPAYTAQAAVFGPFSKERQPINWRRVAFVAVYVAAFVVVALDAFVWRA